jgi:hypothetical protein
LFNQDLDRHPDVIISAQTRLDPHASASAGNRSEPRPALLIMEVSPDLTNEHGLTYRFRA